MSHSHSKHTRKISSKIETYKQSQSSFPIALKSDCKKIASTVETYQHSEYSSSIILVPVKLDQLHVEVLMVMQIQNIPKSNVNIIR